MDKGEIKRFMVRQVVGYGIENPPDGKEINFVMDSKGVKKVVKNEIGTFTGGAEEVPGLKEVKKGFTGKLPKIPVTILLQINQFFKKHGVSEAMAQIFWNREKKEYFVYIPEQEVTGASVHAKRDEALEKKHLLVMDIHSHNTMGAFFSGTDNEDEKELRLFGVIGKIDAEMGSSILCRAGGEQVSLEEIFDIPEAPKDWDKNIKIQPATSTIGYGYGSYGNYYSRDGQGRFVSPYSWEYGEDTDNDHGWLLKQILRLPNKKIRKLIKKIRKILDKTEKNDGKGGGQSELSI